MNNIFKLTTENLPRGGERKSADLQDSGSEWIGVS